LTTIEISCINTFVDAHGGVYITTSYLLIKGEKT